MALPAVAAQKSRPESGSGVVLIRPFSPLRGNEIATLTLYQEPGVARIAELETVRIPPLDQVLQAPTGEFALPVTAKKGEWLRLPYDEAGREGWVKMERYWRYLPWETFLKGRSAQLLPGLKNGSLVLRREASERAPVVGNLSRERSLKIVEIDGDWALAVVDLTSLGWLRWRDRDGRFLIAVTDHLDRQNY